MGIYQWSKTAADNDDAADSIDWTEGQSPGSVNDSARRMMADVAEFVEDISCANTTGGTSSALTLTTSGDIESNSDGTIISFIAGTAANSGATLAVDGNTAKELRRNNDEALQSGDIQSGAAYLAVYDASADGGSGAWLVLNPSVRHFTTTPVVFEAQNPNIRFDDSDTSNNGEITLDNTLLRIEVDEDNAVASSAIVFRVDATEKARIDDGNFYVGTTNNNPAGNNVQGAVITDDGLLTISRDGGSSGRFNRHQDGALLSFLHQGNNVGTITVDSSSTSYNTSSDYRMKQDITDLDINAVGARFDMLQPRQFAWKSTGRPDWGFIAHEVQAIFPTLVQGEKDGNEMQSVAVASPAIMAAFVRIIQDLRARTAELEAKVDALENPAE